MREERGNQEKEKCERMTCEIYWDGKNPFSAALVGILILLWVRKSACE